MRDELPAQGYFFPNKMGRMVLLALEEVLGQNGLNTVLNLARLSHLSAEYPPPNFVLAVPFDEVTALLVALDEMYGTRSGHLLALRAGRACFKYGIRDLGALVGLADVGLRLLPLSWRVRIGCEVLAEILNRYSDYRVVLRQDNESYLWVTERCGFCWQRQTSYPACALMVGLLQETLYWVSDGRKFAVEEVSCIAMGDATCTLRVGKRPQA